MLKIKAAAGTAIFAAAVLTGCKAESGTIPNAETMPTQTFEAVTDEVTEKAETSVTSQTSVTTTYELIIETLSEEVTTELTQASETETEAESESISEEETEASVIEPLPTDAEGIYLHYLKNRAIDEGYVYFDLCDIDKDGTPELCVTKGVEHDDKVDIYTVDDEKFIFLGSFGTYGMIYVSENGNMFYTDERTSDEEDTDIRHGVFLSKNGNNIQCETEFYMNGDDTRLNGRKVTDEEYFEEMMKYESYEPCMNTGCTFEISSDMPETLLNREGR